MIRDSGHLCYQPAVSCPRSERRLGSGWYTVCLSINAIEPRFLVVVPLVTSARVVRMLPFKRGEPFFRLVFLFRSWYAIAINATVFRG